MPSPGVRLLIKLQSPGRILVLMDIKLQGEMDGIEAANIIIKTYDIPIVFLTAFFR